MKKLIAGTFTAVLMSAGLVSAGGTSAVAADPYPGTVDTKVNVNAPASVQDGRRAVIRAKVKTSGNGTAKGDIKVIVQRNGGGYYFSDIGSAPDETFVTSALKKTGKYTVTVKYLAKDGSVFQDSNDSDTFRVR